MVVVGDVVKVVKSAGKLHAGAMAKVVKATDRNLFIMDLEDKEAHVLIVGRRDVEKAKA